MSDHTLGTTPELHLRGTQTGTRLKVCLIPRAGRTGVTGLRHGALLCRIAAAPVDDAANAALTTLPSETLLVGRRGVHIVAGRHSRMKEVKVDGLSPPDVSVRLSPYLPNGAKQIFSP